MQPPGASGEGRGEPRPMAHRPYRFGFVLNTTIGNMTRYLNLRKYAEMDSSVACTWAPVNHYTPPDLKTRLRVLPGPLFMRARLLQQAAPVLGHLDHFDAVMVHLFEADLLLALRSYVRSGPLRISSTDEAPIVDRSRYPLYPSDLTKAPWRQKMRLAIDLWRVGRTDMFIPFSEWAANILTQACKVPTGCVFPLHVGLDLDLWSAPRVPAAPSSRPRILFVGGDFDRKGGPLLVDVFRRRFQDRAELHLVSKQVPAGLPSQVFVHSNFEANDGKLAALYGSADMVVIPTTADTGPLWAFMEGMAMRLPIIGTDTGANLELIRHGETGLVVRIGDGEGLGAAIETLLADPARARAMGQAGSILIERRFSARVNVPRILQLMKDEVTRRAGAHR